MSGITSVVLKQSEHVQQRKLKQSHSQTKVVNAETTTTSALVSMSQQERTRVYVFIEQREGRSLTASAIFHALITSWFSGKNNAGSLVSVGGGESRLKLAAGR
jgi:hypothetical protein